MSLQAVELQPDDDENAATTDAAGPGLRRGHAHFAIGAVLLVLAIVLLEVATGATFYTMEYRNGPQPDGADTANHVTILIGLSTHTAQQRTDEGTVTDENTERYRESAVGTGEIMQRLRYTTVVGVVLLGLAFLAAVLHRFGALNVPGPAPILAAFGSILPFVGLVPFVLDIAHHVWLDWGRGLVSPPPAFFTVGLDGTQLHDLAMQPAAGFWLHAAGTVLAPIGAVLVFAGPLRRLAGSLRGFAATDA